MARVTSAAADRLELVLGASALFPTDQPSPVPSDSNEVWLIHDRRHGDVVLRIGWRGDTSRLMREGAVARAIPTAVGYPAMISFGRVPGTDLTWTLTRRLVGEPLSEAWPRLDHRTRSQACEQVATRVMVLHRWRPPPHLFPVLALPPVGPDTAAATVIGRSINPLPDGIPALVRELRKSGHPIALVERAVALLDRDKAVWPRWDAPSTAVVHGDLHLGNVWWDGTDVTGLFDLEWVRAAPPYAELARVKDNADADDALGLERHSSCCRP